MILKPSSEATALEEPGSLGLVSLFLIIEPNTASNFLEFGVIQRGNLKSAFIILRLGSVSCNLCN